VDPVRDPLLFSFSGSAGNRTRASGFVAKNTTAAAAAAAAANNNNNNNNNNNEPK
jgi:hypothetical protein